MKNKQCLYLCHMTPEEKKAYNKRYYEEHKDYWREYYGRKMGGSDLTGAAKAARDRAVEAKVQARLAEEFKRYLAERERLDPLLSEFNMWTDKVQQWNREDGFDDSSIQKGFVPNKPYVYKNPVTKKFETDYDTDKRSYVRYKSPLSFGVRNTVNAIKSSRDIDDYIIDQKRQEAMKNASAASARGVTVMTPAVKNTKVSEIVDAGKSAVKKFASIWKLGWK